MPNRTNYFNGYTMQLIMTKGLPASGKTTWAKEQNVYRVNKDDLRAMLNNGHWSGINEAYVLRIRDMIINLYLGDKNDVCVDDTNLSPKHEARLRQLAKENGADFVIKDFTNVPVDVCIERDRKRPNSVGKRVIMDMYRKYLYKPPTPPKVDPSLPHAIICDIDGTLAVFDHRSPYDTAQCLTDKLNFPVDMITGLYWGITDQKVILCSGREEKFREVTEQWLGEKKVSYDKLFMRPTGDFRKDAIIKQEIYDREIKGKYNIDFVLDDRNQVVEMWRANGLTCLQVAPGDF